MRHIVLACRVALVATLLSGCASQAEIGLNNGPLRRPNAQEAGAPLLSRPGDRTCFSEKGLLGSPPGTLTARLCVRENIDAAAARHDLAWLRTYVAQLQGFYEQRSRRQQLFADELAAGTFIGALGAGLSGRVGGATQRAWLGAAFFPILVSSVNSNEPTRDLFFAGQLAVDQIEKRYKRMEDVINMLEAFPGGYPDCKGIALRAGEIVGWKEGGDRGVLLPEANRLLASCSAVLRAEGQIQSTLLAAKTYQTQWPKEFRDAVMSLDIVLENKDREFRSSPSETLALLAAAPFRTLDTILTGQDTTEAVKKLQTATTFDKMNIELGSFVLPEPPETPASVATISPEAYGRAGVSRRDDGQPAAPAVAEVVFYMDSFARDLAAARDRTAYRTRLVQDFNSLVGMTALIFQYDIKDGRVFVMLTPPPAPQNPAQPVAVSN